MMVIDETLRMAAAGDMKAFEELYEQHHRRVFSLCLRLTRNGSEAEDLTQEVFIHLFRKLKTFRGEASFTTWLHRLTLNQVLMHFRKPYVRAARRTEDKSEPVRVVHGTENPSRMSLIDRIALDKAIRQLPAGYRTVFILHDVEGYEHGEISRIMGCAVGTSKSQLHKARLKLRRLLTRRVSPKKSFRELCSKKPVLKLGHQMA